MKQKIILKIVVDIGMTVILLFLMAYELIGEAAHEWLGIGMLVLFIIHHILNRKWSRSVFKGKYTLFRIWQTVLVIGILFTMVGSMYSGVILSKHALSVLPIEGRRTFAREIHMVSAYCGFVLISLHLGFHWGMMIGMAGRFVKELPIAGGWMLRGIVVLVAGYAGGTLNTSARIPILQERWRQAIYGAFRALAYPHVRNTLRRTPRSCGVWRRIR